MGILNLLKAAYSGKVGQTVGAKWKDKHTVRVYTIPTNPKTQAQETVRAGFKAISEYVALFADPLRTVSPLDTRGMSVRNAIMKLNKEMIAGDSFDAATLQISRGGLPVPTLPSSVTIASPGAISVNLTEVEGATITSRAKIVLVAVNETKKTAAVSVNNNTTGAVTVDLVYQAGDKINFYAYTLDYRGSSKVGSKTAFLTATAT